LKGGIGEQRRFQWVGLAGEDIVTLTAEFIFKFNLSGYVLISKSDLVTLFSDETQSPLCKCGIWGMLKKKRSMGRPAESNAHVVPGTLFLHSPRSG
jgi:hypothetical protein